VDFLVVRRDFFLEDLQVRLCVRTYCAARSEDQSGPREADIA
jgi:hypothetical protein